MNVIIKFNYLTLHAVAEISENHNVDSRGVIYYLMSDRRSHQTHILISCVVENNYLNYFSYLPPLKEAKKNSQPQPTVS